MSSPDEYLRHADLCIARATSVRDPHLVPVYLSLAEEWRELADILHRDRRDTNLLAFPFTTLTCSGDWPELLWSDFAFEWPAPGSDAARSAKRI
jgi:hypothetical protein